MSYYILNFLNRELLQEEDFLGLFLLRLARSLPQAGAQEVFVGSGAAPTGSLALAICHINSVELLS